MFKSRWETKPWACEEKRPCCGGKGMSLMALGFCWGLFFLTKGGAAATFWAAKRVPRRPFVVTAVSLQKVHAAVAFLLIIVHGIVGMIVFRQKKGR